MDDSYKIKEISRLYGLCTDTLRYYEEQGILSPRRAANQYRMFGVQDIGNLNVVRSLRELDIPIKRIREYIHNRNIKNTLELFEEEEKLLQEKMERLKAQYQDVQQRRMELLKDQGIKDQQFSFSQYGDRPCFKLGGGVILENNIDFILKKLERQYEDNIHVIGIKGFGAQLEQCYIEKGIYTHFDSVFFISDWDNYNSVIPGGLYASMYFWGEYERIGEILPKFAALATAQGAKVCGPFMEFYHIDMSDTNESREYLTELQVKIK